jgi:hypothetical protein
MDQKLENILNLALETPEEEREQTESLNVGYSAESRSWELIVKYLPEKWNLHPVWYRFLLLHYQILHRD